MKLSCIHRLLTGATALVLAACASQSDTGQADGFTPVEVVTGGETTVIYPVTGFKSKLLDNDYQCRLWAYGRDGRAMRPCAGEVPSCGEPVSFSNVSVVNAGSAPVAATLVTEGIYRAYIEHTIEDTKRQLASRIAREGCDLLIVDGEEWISLRRGNNFRYLQVRWGSTTNQEVAQGAP